MHRARLVVRLRLFVFLAAGGASCRARCIQGGGPAGRTAIVVFSHGSYCGRTLARDCSGCGVLAAAPNGSVCPISRASSASGSLSASRARVRAAIVIVGVGGKRSVLISISHREDASPSGQRQPAMTTLAMTNELAPARYPHKSPFVRAFAPAYRISVGAWTPRTAKPDARTETTPWTIASRAFVISASLLIMKRK